MNNKIALGVNGYIRVVDTKVTKHNPLMLVAHANKTWHEISIDTCRTII